jgi:hypothetical protein
MYFSYGAVHWLMQLGLRIIVWGNLVLSCVDYLIDKGFGIMGKIFLITSTYFVNHITQWCRHGPRPHTPRRGGPTDLQNVKLCCQIFGTSFSASDRRRVRDVRIVFSHSYRVPR